MTCNKEKLEVQAEIREETRCVVWACEQVSHHSPRALWVSSEMQVCLAPTLSPSPSTLAGDALVLFPALPSCSTNANCSSQWGRIRVQWQWRDRCQSTGDTWKHSKLKEEGKVISYNRKLLAWRRKFYIIQSWRNYFRRKLHWFSFLISVFWGLKNWSLTGLPHLLSTISKPQKGWKHQRSLGVRW